MTIHAHTEVGHTVPAYLNVRRDEAGHLWLTVRSRGVLPGAQMPAEIELSVEELGALAVNLLRYYNEAA